MVSGYKFLTFRLHLWQASLELAASTVASEVLLLPLQKQQLKQPPLKIPATDAGETSGIFNLRPRPTSPEDAGRENLN